MPERNFVQLKQDLEQAVSTLKTTEDHKLRRDMLLELRLLLLEADQLLLETSE
jgi:hypothetical protein